MSSSGRKHRRRMFRCERPDRNAYIEILDTPQSEISCDRFDTTVIDEGEYIKLYQEDTHCTGPADYCIYKRVLATRGLALLSIPDFKLQYSSMRRNAVLNMFPLCVTLLIIPATYGL